MEDVLYEKVGIHFGADGPEGGMEGLYQTMTGAGYDQDCDASFLGTTDVLPFHASEDDPFGGTEGGLYSTGISGSGTLGGVGFRDGSLPLVLYGTSAYIRDPDAGYGSPGGCWADAGSTDVAAAMNAMGARLLGVSASGSLAMDQLLDLADATDSRADTDGDGESDDLLVVYWSTTDAALGDWIINSLDAVITGASFDEVSLQVVGDDWGLVSEIDPVGYTDVEVQDDGTLSFILTLYTEVEATTGDQHFPLTLKLYGDNRVLLGGVDVIVVVPGEGG